jgi:hypothetical protein
LDGHGVGSADDISGAASQSGNVIGVSIASSWRSGNHAAPQSGTIKVIAGTRWVRMYRNTWGIK